MSKDLFDSHSIKAASKRFNREQCQVYQPVLLTPRRLNSASASKSLLGGSHSKLDKSKALSDQKSKRNPQHQSCKKDEYWTQYYRIGVEREKSKKRAAEVAKRTAELEEERELLEKSVHRKY